MVATSPKERAGTLRSTVCSGSLERSTCNAQEMVCVSHPERTRDAASITAASALITEVDTFITPSLPSTGVSLRASTSDSLTHRRAARRLRNAGGSNASDSFTWRLTFREGIAFAPFSMNLSERIVFGRPPAAGVSAAAPPASSPPADSARARPFGLAF